MVRWDVKTLHYIDMNVLDTTAAVLQKLNITKSYLLPLIGSLFALCNFEARTAPLVFDASKGGMIADLSDGRDPKYTRVSCFDTRAELLAFVQSNNLREWELCIW